MVRHDGVPEAYTDNEAWLGQLVEYPLCVFLASVEFMLWADAERAMQASEK